MCDIFSIKLILFTLPNKSMTEIKLENSLFHVWNKSRMIQSFRFRFEDFINILIKLEVYTI
jgi:hypothetical protein